MSEVRKLRYVVLVILSSTSHCAVSKMVWSAPDLGEEGLLQVTKIFDQDKKYLLKINKQHHIIL